jgi:hypothetical protein
MLRTFAVVAEPDAVAAQIVARFGGLVDRFSFYAPYPSDFDMWTPIVAALHREVTAQELHAPTRPGQCGS